MACRSPRGAASSITARRLYCFFTSLVLMGSEDFALSYCSHFTAELILNVGVILFHQSNRTRESRRSSPPRASTCSQSIAADTARAAALKVGGKAGRLINTLWREILREGLQPEPAEPAVGLRSARPSL